jgi:hypothetical protein
MKLAWALAAVVALGGAADATPKTQVISLDGYCDVLTLQINRTKVVGADDPGCDPGLGVGYVSRVKGFGKAIVAGTVFGDAPGALFIIRVAYPLVTGGNWDLALTADGVNFTSYESGTYTIEGTADKGERGTTPVVAKSMK